MTEPGAPKPGDAMMRDTHSSELERNFEAWIARPEFKTNPLALPSEYLRILVPKKIFEIASHPENIVIEPYRNEGNELSFLVFEKNYPVTITDKSAWDQWQLDREAARAKKKEGKSRFTELPQSPENVDRLHARFVDEILSGELSLNDRILMYIRMRVKPDAPEALLVTAYDGEVGKGIASEFYTETLPTIAKKLGFRYLYGQNSVKNISFFTNTLKRVTMRDIKPEYREQLFPGFGETDPRAATDTIQFLYPEDEEKYRIEK